MELGKYLEERVANWDGLSRWEKSELGKDLRRAGLSYGEVMALIPVKKSTLATWCRKVRLTDEQYQAIKTRTGSQEGIPRDTNRKRRQEIELIQREARERARDLGCDPLFTAGVALYWGEGSKTSRRLEMAHSEPEALRFFMRWTRVFLHPDAAFAACLNLHADNDEPAARTFWSTELGIVDDDFTKSFIKPDGTGHRKNHLPWGVCRVTMRRSTDAFIATMVWIDFLKDWCDR